VATLELARRTREMKAYQHPPNITHWPKQHSILDSRHLKRERKGGREEAEGKREGEMKSKRKRMRKKTPPSYLFPQLPPQV